MFLYSADGQPPNLAEQIAQRQAFLAAGREQRRQNPVAGANPSGTGGQLPASYPDNPGFRGVGGDSSWDPNFGGQVPGSYPGVPPQYQLNRSLPSFPGASPAPSTGRPQTNTVPTCLTTRVDLPKIVDLMGKNQTVKEQTLPVIATVFSRACQSLQKEMDQKESSYSPLSCLLALCGILPALTADKQNTIFDLLVVKRDEREAFLTYVGYFHKNYSQHSHGKTATALLSSNPDCTEMAKMMGIQFFSIPSGTVFTDSAITDMNQLIEKNTQTKIDDPHDFSRPRKKLTVAGIKDLLPNRFPEQITANLTINVLTDRKKWVAKEVVVNFTGFDEKSQKVKAIQFKSCMPTEIEMGTYDGTVFIKYNDIIFGINPKKIVPVPPDYATVIQWRKVEVAEFTVPMIDIPDIRIDVTKSLPLDSLTGDGIDGVQAQSAMSILMTETGWDAKAATYVEMFACGAPAPPPMPSVSIMIDTPFSVGRTRFLPVIPFI